MTALPSAPADVFRCAPLHVTMAARVCVARRAEMRTAGSAGPSWPMYRTCRRCDLGAQVEAALVPVAAVVRSASHSIRARERM